MWVGCQQGTDYTNFLFLANCKTNMMYDMNLNYYERELVCNLLLISNDVGGFFASLIGYAYLMYEMPEALFNPPNWATIVAGVRLAGSLKVCSKLAKS